MFTLESQFLRWKKISLLIALALLTGGLLLSHQANADYAPRIQDPSTGYIIKLASDSIIAQNPIKGTNGKNYYRVGEPISINENSIGVSVTGLVKCTGTSWWGVWPGGTDIPAKSAHHRLFMFAPMAGTDIDGKVAYRINNNLVMTVDTRIMQWINIEGGACSLSTPSSTLNASDFTVQFPITVTFYINERIIDGQLPIAGMELGGYVRAFTRSGLAPPQTSWPLSDSSVPMRLAASQLNVGSSCSTMTSTGQAGTVNLRHGQLNSLNYNSTVTENVIYTCKFSQSTKVRLRLDYATDSDPQQRLPMKSGQNKIYSELTMMDEVSGQTGKDFKIDIQDLRTIKISSHIQGTNAVAGEYKGSAWLIATFN
nr:adhesin [Providencia sp.]